MNFFRDSKRKRLIPGAIVSASAATYGSGGSALAVGVLDTKGYNRVFVEFFTRSGTSGASKLSKPRLAFQSGAATLMASAVAASGAISGYTSGRMFTSSTLSTLWVAFDINLRGVKCGTTGIAAKRYLNAACTMSTAGSRPVTVMATLYNGEAFPPAAGATTTGPSAITNIG